MSDLNGRDDKSWQHQIIDAARLCLELSAHPQIAATRIGTIEMRAINL